MSCDWIGIIGTVLSLIGIIVAILQINKTKKAAEAAQGAAQAAINAIHLNVTLADISTCINEVEEIKVMIRSERYEAALLRVTDLSGKIIQLKTMPKSKFIAHINNSKEMLTQLSVLRDLLERKLQDKNVKVHTPKVNKILSAISDDLHIWIGNNKYIPPGEIE